MSQDVLEDHLQKTKPWNFRPFPKVKDKDPHSAALGIDHLLWGYLDEAGDPELTGFVESTSWRVRHPSPEYYWWENPFCYDGGPYWRVRTLVEQKSSKLPHITCILADEAKMVDKKLSTSEVFCAICLMTGRSIPSEFARHQLAPVSVVSIADRKLRVLQVYYDPAQERIIVRKSKIFDFKKEDYATTKLVVAWMAGDPVGETRFKRYQNSPEEPVSPPTREKSKIRRPSRRHGLHIPEGRQKIFFLGGKRQANPTAEKHDRTTTSTDE